MNRQQAADHHQRLHEVIGTTPPEQLAGQIGNFYAIDSERYIVSLVIGYSEDDDVQSVQDAARAALELTREEGSYSTHWYVFDRETQTLHLLEQRDFDDTFE